MQAESPPVLAVDVIVAADPPDELVSPGSIRGVGADDGAAEEEISQRYLRREGDFVEIVMSPEGGIVLDPFAGTGTTNMDFTVTRSGFSWDLGFGWGRN